MIVNSAIFFDCPFGGYPYLNDRVFWSSSRRWRKNRGGDHIVGLSVFPLAWILNRPSANQYGSRTMLVLIPELSSYDTLGSSIHHSRCRLKCQTSYESLCSTSISLFEFFNIPIPYPNYVPIRTYSLAFQNTIIRHPSFPLSCCPPSPPTIFSYPVFPILHLPSLLYSSISKDSDSKCR